MIRTFIKSTAVFAAIALSAGVALAQGVAPLHPPVNPASSPSQDQSTNGPAGTYDMNKTTTTVAPDGATTDVTQRFDKSQSYTSGNGALSAHTHIETVGPATNTDTTTTPPRPRTRARRQPVNLSRRAHHDQDFAERLRGLRDDDGRRIRPGLDLFVFDDVANHDHDACARAEQLQFELRAEDHR
jgi:hypothetical protein